MSTILDEGGNPHLAGRSEIADRCRAEIGRLDTTGTGIVLAVTGPAGIGKSTFASLLTSHARELGVAVSSVRVTPGTHAAAMSAVSELLGEAATNTDQPRAVAGLGPYSPSLDAVLERAEQIVGRTPTMLVVDDAHWCDVESLRALERLGALVHDRPLIMVLLARESWELSKENSHLARIAARLGPDHLRLEPLNPTDALSLARHIVGAEPDAPTRSLLSRAGGNPLLIAELLAALSARAARQPDQPVDLATAGERLDLSQAVDWRLAALSEVERIVMQRAAVLGPDFTGDQIAALSGMDIVELAPVLGNLCRSGLLVERGAHLTFRHDLIREAIYERNTPSVRHSLHREVATILESHGAPAIAVLEHRARGAIGPDDEIARQMLDTAESQVGNDPTRMLQLLDRALLIAESGELRRSIEQSRAAPLARIGRLDEAADLLVLAIDHASDPDARARSRWMYAGVLSLSNLAPAAIEQLRLGAEETSDPVLRARLVGEEAMAKLATADPTTKAVALRAIELALASGDRTAEVAGRCALARELSRTHLYAEGLEQTQLAVAIAESAPTDGPHRFTPWFYHGLMLLDLERPTEVASAIANGRRTAERLRNSWADPLFSGLAASLHYRDGRLNDAEAEARAGIAQAEDSGTLLALGWCHAIVGEIEMLRGEMAAANDHIDTALAHLHSGQAPLGIDFVLRVDALRTAVNGDPAAALTKLLDAWAGLKAFGAIHCLPLLAVSLTRLAAAAGDTATVSAVRQEVASWGDSSSYFSPLLGLCDGYAKADAGALARTANSLPPGRGLGRMIAMVDAIGLLGAAGERAAAKHLGEEIMAALRLSGSTGLINRAARYCPDVSAEPDGQGDTLDELTPAEREVALLAAEGATNAEIARRRGTSVRTVEAQLHRCYFKLDVSSRTKLAVRLLRADTAFH